MTTTPEEKKKLTYLETDWLVSHIRWGWLFLMALFILADNLLSTSNSFPNLLRLVALVAVGLILNGIYVGMLSIKSYPNWLAIIATFLDIALAIIFFVLIMDRQQPQILLPVMILPVIMSGVRWSTEIGLITALVITLVYGLPLVPILKGEINRLELIGTLLTLVSTALALFIAGGLPAPFIRLRVKMIESSDEDELTKLHIENERGKLITEMALTMSSTLDYRKVLRIMIDLAFSAMVGKNIEDENSVGMVLLFESGDDLLTVAVGRNTSSRDLNRKVSSETGLVGRTINTAEACITHNAQKDKTLTSFASTSGCRSAICAPLRAGFDTYGVVLFSTTKTNAYNKEYKALLTTFCSQAIIPLQNAQLFDDVHREQKRILEKEAEARRKLSRDLHDGPTQSIAAIAMRLNFIKMVIKNGEMDKAHEEIIKVEEIALNATHEIRTMLFTMRPVILETQGLVSALDQYAERLINDGVFKTTITNKGYEGQLSTESEGVIFSIIEEAVGNAKKHSQATEMKIDLFVSQDVLTVDIKDNGVGFDVEATTANYDQRGSLGLINMDERAQAIGGTCVLKSRPGQGTTVHVELPV